MKQPKKRLITVRLVFVCLLGAWLAIAVGTAVAADQGGDSARPPKYRADRDLSENELKELFRLCDILIDKRKDWGDREVAVNQLSEKFSHKYAIPALLAVLRDETDHSGVRQRCVLALSWTADRKVLDYLIEALLDDDMNVWYQAHHQLEWLTGPQEVPLGRFGPERNLEMRKRLHQWWRDWWDAHRDDFELTWGEAR
ncbi:MAG: HEAT repeat domain-containing protein [Planctomycetota bacterium]|jgi:hypothetical protein